MTTYTEDQMAAILSAAIDAAKDAAANFTPAEIDQNNPFAAFGTVGDDMKIAINAAAYTAAREKIVALGLALRG